MKEQNKAAVKVDTIQNGDKQFTRCKFKTLIIRMLSESRENVNKLKTSTKR